MIIHKSKFVFNRESSFLVKSVFYVLSFVFFTFSAQAATFTVNTLADNESDGCAANQCTLREAVSDANSLAGNDTINFQSGLTGIIVLNGTQITINSNVTIDGPGARNLSVSGNNESRVFLVTNPVLGSATVNISRLTITGGNALPLLLNGTLVGDGGGILNTGGATLNLTEVTVAGNTATSLGGGVATRAVLLVSTETNITRSTISNNTSVAGGGGVSNLGTQLISSATTTITNSTISNNSCLAEGGGISNTLATMRLTNNTISHNSSTVAGGGIVNVSVLPLGSVSMRNNIVAANRAVVNTNLISSDLLGTFNSLGNNLIGNRLNVEASFSASVFVGGSPVPNPNGDIVGTVTLNRIIDPLLGGLQNNGGPTNTRLQLFGSPSINRGNNCVLDNTCPSLNLPSPLTTDQRGTGFPRQVSASVDIGATEGETTAPASFTVTTLADNESDGCAINQCTLREAITAANDSPDTNVINFQNGLTGTILLTNGQLVPSTNMTIQGPGAHVINVSGNDISRVFMIATPILGGDITVNINNIEITRGMATAVGGLAGDGGGILNGALLGVISGKSTLNLREVSITNNQATTLGGGVATRLGAETNITRSYIARNRSNAIPFIPTGDVGGGGVSNAVLSTTNINNSTITDNSSLASGGGILNAAGMVNLTNNTISNNRSALLGGGIASLVGVVQPLGVTYMRNTILADNRAFFTTSVITSDAVGVLGSIRSLGHNLIGNNDGAELIFPGSIFDNNRPIPNINGDLVGILTREIDPRLSGVNEDEEDVDYRIPLPDSPALNAGDNCVVTNTCAVNPFGKNPQSALTTDQRGTGYPRRADSAVEIGSIEVPQAPASTEISISGYTVTENGDPIIDAAINITTEKGQVLSATSNEEGYFIIENIEPEQTLILHASHKVYRFAAQVLTPHESEEVILVGYINDRQRVNNASSVFK